MIIVWALYEIIAMRKLVGRFKPDFVLFVEVLTIMSLLCTLRLNSVNILFGIFHTLFILLYLEVIFGNYYYLMIFSYVGYNVIPRGSMYRIILNCLVVFFAGLYLGSFVDRAVTELQACKGISITYSRGLVFDSWYWRNRSFSITFCCFFI